MEALLHFITSTMNGDASGSGSLCLKAHQLLQELVRKKRYGRLQKALADISLLAGSPADAEDHYTTAAELCRVSNDWLWTAAALQGLAHAKVSSVAWSCFLHAGMLTCTA